MKMRGRITTAVIFAITALIIVYAGLFLLRVQEGPRSTGEVFEPAVETTEGKPAQRPVRHFQLDEKINGNRQQINILEIDPGAEGARIVPALSHDLIYGYENLSVIAARKKAYAAINAGFFNDYGMPAGMVAADGEVFTLPTGKYPVFFIKDGKAGLGAYPLEMWLEYGGGRVRVNKLNAPITGEGYAVYTPVYGETNRVSEENYTITIRNGVVKEAGLYQDATVIPDDGMLITFVGDLSSGDISLGDVSALSLQKGDHVKLVSDPQASGSFQAYECGSWIVRDGNVVIGQKDPWIGVTTNNDPRTAVGIKADGTVVMLTVDGRQPGYSEGMSCSALGKYLVGYGVVNAAMLDGGASTEMIVEGKIVNKPSYKGQERPVGGGLVIITK